ncbi:Protein of unknown function [Pyronema omphalodes CBS 100304]|uniref:Uncharacterized protein n=1 Tax=Pyronema omphalodes (strain CBS 100304) TaxID=1076935 RepID=U4LPH3_PYROM|nr:Protein of unknown function [Pyronema omphalodes CBS 100304]
MNGRLVDNEKNMQEKLVEKEKKMQEYAEKRLGETEDYFKQQVEGRLTENEKQIQQRLGISEVKIWGHGQEIQQKVKESIAEHGTFVEQVAAVVLSETVNEQGYFTRMIPMKQIPNDMTQITGTYGGGCLYVERKKIETSDNFKNLIKGVWGLDLILYQGCYQMGGFNRRYSYTPRTGPAIISPLNASLSPRTLAMSPNT